MAATPCLSERAIASVMTLLGSISTSNGFETDAGDHVFRARQTIDKRETPCCNVWEGQEIPNVDSKTRSKIDMRLLLHIEGHIEADQSDTGAMLGKIKADIKRAVLGGSRNGGLPDPPNPRPFAVIGYEGSSPSPRADGANTEAVTVTLSLNYSEAYGDPYTSG